jgi:hypothetical protein
MRHLTRRPLARSAPTFAAAVLAGCGSGSLDPADDWGPPAGYAVVAGTVVTAAGAPAGGVEVLLSRCASPVGGYLGRATTDAAGRYRVEGALPPVGFLRAAPDTLRVRCAVFTDRTGVARDSLVVRFRAAAAGPPLQQLDLRLP